MCFKCLESIQKDIYLHPEAISEEQKTWSIITIESLFQALAQVQIPLHLVWKFD